ncbi:MAG TPA: MFS transporter, partial [Humibacter sp.]|nr:MFS transporter [Humibacter sp.]
MNGTPLSTRTKPAAGAVRAFIASLTGTSLEYYDFAVYSVASALVFPAVFFPAED